MAEIKFWKLFYKQKPNDEFAIFRTLFVTIKKCYAKQLSEKWSELVHSVLNQMTNKKIIFIALMLILLKGRREKIGWNSFLPSDGWVEREKSVTTWSDIRARKKRKKSNKISAVSLVAINLNYCFICEWVYVTESKKRKVYIVAN